MLDALDLLTLRQVAHVRRVLAALPLQGLSVHTRLRHFLNVVVVQSRVRTNVMALVPQTVCSIGVSVLVLDVLQDALDELAAWSPLSRSI